MTNIHVLLIDYSNSATLKKALESLKFIEYRIKGISILENNKFLLQLTDFSTNQEINYIKIIRNDLGITLNEHIKKLSTEYILFLYTQDFFNVNIKNINLELYNDKYVITYPYIIKDKVIQRPFLVKTDFLKKKPFFSKYQIPFKEAVLSSWLSTLNKFYIKSEWGNFINQRSKGGSTSILQKLNFIEKYHYKSEKNINSPSVSVIISNYNMAHYVGIAINSCLLQQQPPEQILVIDDGSTDNSYKELEKWREFPQFKLFKKKNGGKARALNYLLPYINTEFVVELDADDWFDPDAFLVIRKYLKIIPEDVAVLYGNLRIWKQMYSDDVKYKGVMKGKSINNKTELLSYRFPLGPRIYRTSILKKNSGFPIIDLDDGRMYEDVSILNQLFKKNRLLYEDFTIYNVREHKSSITKKNHSNWNDFLKYLD